MTPQEMIDIAFRGLDDAELQRAEKVIAKDPELTATLERIDRKLELLLDDGDEFEPPAGLAQRTLAHVASYRPRRSILEYVPVTVPFRWADVAVAASIFIAGLVTLLPAVHRSKLQNDQALCTFNLGQLGRGLANYASAHGYYPYPPRDCPIPYAGIYKVMLNDSGHLGNPALLDCPCNGHEKDQRPLPDYETLCQMEKRDPERFRFLLKGDYAYHLGYRYKSGQPGPIPARLTSLMPLLADRPGHDERTILPGNSPNHGGVGQNVLFKDGHVGFFSTRRLSPHDNDMFLNDEMRPEPGLTSDDAVLAPGQIPFFDGR